MKAENIDFELWRRISSIKFSKESFEELSEKDKEFYLGEYKHVLIEKLIEKLVPPAWSIDEKGGIKIKQKLYLSEDDKEKANKSRENLQEKEIEELQELVRDLTFDSRFLKENLLQEIHKELDKDHKLDHKEKIALFLIRVSAELKEPSDRCSSALKGDSSAGKDNAIKTILKHFPEKDNFFLTRGTQSALEEEASKVKCIAFSEINKHRENGANNELTEVFKQLAEGGVDVIKKDATTGYRTTARFKSEQKTLFYGTTETESDEELETRYVIIPIRSNSTKNKIVVDDYLRKLRNPENYSKKKISWITKSIMQLDNDIQIIIPFTELFENKIKDTDGKEKYLFDYTKERIKRDAKRLFSLTKAITWLYQKQRANEVINGQKFIYAEPSDFLTALEIFAEFFNLTYTGLDHRTQRTFEKIEELRGKHDAEILKMGYDSKYFGWVLRHKLAEELGIQSVDTIKKRINQLKDYQMVEGHYQQEIPRGYLIRGCEQGTNRVSLPISLVAISTLLIAYLTPKIIKEIYKDKKISSFQPFFQDLSVSSEKLTPSKLTPSISPDIHTPKEPKIMLENVSDETYTHELEGDVSFSASSLSNSPSSEELVEFFGESSKEFSEIAFFVGDETKAEELVKKMKGSGVIYEPRQGVYEVLK